MQLQKTYMDILVQAGEKDHNFVESVRCTGHWADKVRDHVKRDRHGGATTRQADDIDDDHDAWIHDDAVEAEKSSIAYSKQLSDSRTEINCSDVDEEEYVNEDCRDQFDYESSDSEW